MKLSNRNKHSWCAIFLCASLFLSCKKSISEKEVILMADMDTPMGHNSLKVFEDKTFKLEHRRLLKTTLFEGNVVVHPDTLKFEYENLEPDFGDVAVIDGIFLTFTNGVSRELLEISLNRLSK